MIGHGVIATTGRVQAGEAGAVFKPHATRGSTKYPIISCHGAAGSWDQWLNNATWPRLNKLLRKAADAGIPSIAEHLGGDTYGNPTFKARITSALTAVASDTGCSSAKVHIVGASMGGTALGWAIDNPTKVATMTLMIPLTSIVNAYALDTGGLRAAIGTAWGVTYPTPLPAAADLLANASALAGIPIRMYYAPDDTLIASSDVLAMKAAIGSSCTATATSGGGHTDVGMLPVNFDFDAWVDWLKTNGG